jgi:hypothetical protein
MPNVFKPTFEEGERPEGFLQARRRGWHFEGESLDEA